MIKTIIFTTFIFFSWQAIAYDYNIVEYGAKNDGKSLNTKMIQNAIDDAHKNNGGRVVIPKGAFVTGSLRLKSNVELHLSKGSILLGSTNIDNYVAISPRKWPALIYAFESQNISITGKGVINGRGGILAMKLDSMFYLGKLDSAFYNLVEKRPLATVRPLIIKLYSCSHIKIENITVKNGASWVQGYWRCNDLFINHIKVQSNSYWNNDGIDLIDSKNVVLQNSEFNCSDDGICLKSETSLLNSENISINNCKVRSSASAVKIGTATEGSFKNIHVSDIDVTDTYRSAIALENYWSGSLENILIENINAKNTGNAIFIKIGKYLGIRRFRNDPPGTIKNVTIRNVKVTVPFEQPDYYYPLRGPVLPYFHNVFPSSITGAPGFPVENITLENIKIIYPGRGNKAYANLPTWRLDDVPENINDYPEFSMFGELPAWGLYVRHVHGLSLKNVTVKIKNPDYRPAMVFDDVINLQMNSIEVKGDSKKENFIFHKSPKPILK